MFCRVFPALIVEGARALLLCACWIKNNRKQAVLFFFSYYDKIEI